MGILRELTDRMAKGEKSVAMLIDQDKYDRATLMRLKGQGLAPTFIMVGGSIVENDTTTIVADIKTISPETPVILFPGDSNQLAPNADAILLLSLISGRNADYLIGQHVRSACRIARMGIEIIPTGYILIDGGRPTSVEYVSGTRPIPADKSDIIVATALAGQQLGLRAIYLEAGSGAINPVSAETISAVRKTISLPIIVGGGLRTTESINRAFEAGADVVVVGTAIEQQPELAAKLLAAK